MFVDSHCHLNYLDNPTQAWANARAAGVDACLCIGVEESTISEVLALARTQPGVWASVGEHPGSCSGDATWVRSHVDAPRVVALGEMGLDYFYSKSASEHALQRKTFAQQLEVAANCRMPVIIHTRDAEDDTLALIREQPSVRGVLHCYTGSIALAEAAMAQGFYVSMSGIVTFNNAANVRDVLRHIPLDRLLIETDAPWLAPKPHRGQINEPAFVVDTAAFIADFLEVPIDELAQRTRDNFFELFDLAREA